MPEFLTTKEVAELLRLKERKIYELVSEEAIPFSRVTGKLLFPRGLVESWVLKHVEHRDHLDGLDRLPPVIGGSHDPLLDWALRESGSALATLYGGSLDGLERLGRRELLGAGMHVYEPAARDGKGDWNREHVAQALPGLPIVLIGWARRQQGLVVPPGNPKGLAKLADLAGCRVIPRQSQAGSRLLLDHLLQVEGLADAAITLVSPPARSEADVASAVAEGKADAGFAIEAVARQYRLDFVPLVEERYDLALWRRHYFEPPMQRLLAFCRTPAFAARAAELGGYDIGCLGEVQFNGF